MLHIKKIYECNFNMLYLFSQAYLKSYCKKLLVTRIQKMETKRVSTGGRRGNKKDAVNNGTKNAKRKGAEDTNVLRTRSGRTRTTTSFNNASTSRKKTSNASASKNSCMESAALKSTKELSSDITAQNVQGEIHISNIVHDDTVGSYSGRLF